MKRALLVVVLLLGALTQVASASVVYPDQKPAPYKTWDLVNGWARPFWGDRDVKACEGRAITVWVAPDLDEAWGRGGDCEVWIRSDLVTWIRYSTSTSKTASREDRTTFRGMLIEACTVVFHETGHALGLPHTETGVMAGDLAHAPAPQAWAPWECRLWARSQTA